MASFSSRRMDLGLLWLRLAMGIGIAYHGYGKVFGGQMGMFTQGVTAMGFPAPHLFAWAAALSEFVGGICVATGFAVRVAAFFICCTMFVAAFVALRHQGLVAPRELALAYFTIAGALMLTGGGAYSLSLSLRRKS